MLIVDTLGARRCARQLWRDDRPVSLRILGYVRRRRRKEGDRSEPARSRTENQQIKSLLLCQLSYGPGWVRGRLWLPGLQDGIRQAGATSKHSTGLVGLGKGLARRR
jgi:hypothetical protein